MAKKKYRRHTSYLPWMCGAVYDYLDSFDMGYEEVELAMQGVTDRLEIGCRLPGEVVPTQSGLVPILGITRETIDEYANSDAIPEFRTAIQELKAKQELILVNKGLVGVFKEGITKIMLSKHGYYIGQNINLGGQNGNNPVVAEGVIRFVDAGPELMQQQQQQQEEEDEEEGQSEQ